MAAQKGSPMSQMLEEIREQPQVLEQTLRLERGTVERLRQFLGRRRFDLVVLIARGTSDNAALFGRYLIEMTTRYLVSLAAPSIHTLYRARPDLRRALAIGISQSGEATDVNRVLRAYRKQGAFTLGITNHANSSITRIVDEVLLTHTGMERSVAATKTYTAQLLLLYELAWALGARFPRRKLEGLPALATDALRLEGKVAETAEAYRSVRHCIVVGRGLNYANAYELALKLMETCYVVAERFSAADLFHGPLAVIEPGFPLFVFRPQGVTRPSLDRMLGQLKTLGAKVLLFTSLGPQLRRQPALVLPRKIPEFWSPIPYIIPAQLFAAWLAHKKGLNPDRPRHLRKITQTL